MKKVLTIVGARPQFIKAGPVSRYIRNFETKLEEIYIHTGQHFDKNMSEVFFNELDLKKPKYNLGISSLSHGAMTGRMIEEVETILIKEEPNLVLVYGDTNSTLAGAIAASKLGIPIFHVESGLRSFNMHMPEEINRTLTDRISSKLFCPTDTALRNLYNEGIREGVINVGDVMLDSSLFYQKRLENKNISLISSRLKENEYILCTLHRQENTDNPSKLRNILLSLNKLSEDSEVVIPIHPRTLKKVKTNRMESLLDKFLVLNPLSYLDFQLLIKYSKAILTDSGGVQKEAYFNSIPCLTLREETEWTETVVSGLNHLVGSDENLILDIYSSLEFEKKADLTVYGDGTASERIVNEIIDL